MTECLDPATLADMLRATMAAVPVGPRAEPEELAEQRQAALVAVTMLRPRDPIEAMLAVRIVSANMASAECFRRAALPDADTHIATKLLSKAIQLANLASRTLRELQEAQAEPPAYAVPLPDAEADTPAALPVASPEFDPVPPAAAHRLPLAAAVT